MPLVVMCGHPASGKTSRAQELASYVMEHHPKLTVKLMNHETMNTDRNVEYRDSGEEKKARGNFKSSVNRLLNRDTLVIADNLNYIKGFRYELFCLVRECATSHAVVYCEVPVETEREWNASRESKYEDEIFEGLIFRFEAPNMKNKWDKPLFHLRVGEPTPCSEIMAVLSGETYTPSSATQPMKLSDSNYLYDMDQRTQAIVSAIMSAQRDIGHGAPIVVPNATDKVELSRQVTLAELRRHRQQFLTMMKQNPPKLTDEYQLGNNFVQYVNNAIRSDC